MVEALPKLNVLDALLEATIRVSSTHNNNRGGDEHDDIEAQEDNIDDGYNGDKDIAQDQTPNAGTFIRDGIKIKKEPLHPLAMVDITGIGVDKFNKRDYRKKSALLHQTAMQEITFFSHLNDYVLNRHNINISSAATNETTANLCQRPCLKFHIDNMQETIRLVNKSI